MISDNRTKAIFQFDTAWRGTAISITHVVRWSDGIDHIEVRSEGRVPLPITGTGYKSHFTNPETLTDYPDAAAFVLAWLEHAASSDEWKHQAEGARQFSLF